ncbi:Protein of unknown function [Nitrosomonas aestuarii]|uniref:Uncharacterized protein n=1 Tax=Nitrosomonas aestuarii TaxID=52441 RepID=A0A1I4G1H2_9PROT|nr:DUF2958 domain-containing protein [Nitrosomonas aestuarii]SFL24002.1 Protein of unknown function [Nitrosomonas aestuarii]
MNAETYQIITPAGAFSAVFDDKESPVKYQGDELAIAFFKNWVDINQINGEHGHLLDSNDVQPFELYGFCQPEGSGIIVLPPFDDLMDFEAENKINEQDTKESDDMQNNITLDAVSGTEKLRLAREAGDIRATLSAAKSGLEKLKLVKRIKEIRDLLGVSSVTAGGGLLHASNDGIELDKNGLDSDGMWRMTRSEYNKIHKDYKGTMPDGVPTALKLINGATTIVPVKITDELLVNEETKSTMADVNKVMPILKQFVGGSQLSAFTSDIRGEEGQFIKDKLVEIATIIQNMPQTYGQDGMGDKAIAYLHYFKGSADWYITEKDMEAEQLQAFGLAELFGDGGELGYISIQELIGINVELDFYWTPKTIGEIKEKNQESQFDQVEGKTVQDRLNETVDNDDSN